MAQIEVLARAKVNLTLHVTGQRDDGYHLLDSLVCFASVGDVVRAEPADDLTLSIDGPFKEGLSETDNLMLDAARLMHPKLGAKLSLSKRLPVASGIGGGSADAAATLRALSVLWAQDLPENVLTLGADVPVCLQNAAVRMGGVGERITAVPKLPDVHAVLVNPRVPVATPDVFKALKSRENDAMPKHIPQFETVADLADWLSGQRNDLQDAAISQVPEISEVLDALGRSLLARMSGSGATCFGLYPTQASADADAKRIAQIYPEWWVTACQFN